MIRKEDTRFIGMPEPNEFPPRIVTQPTCPKCGGHNIEVESCDVLGEQRVEGMDEEGKLVLGRPRFYTAESDFYLSCFDCEYEKELEADPLDEDAIIKWILEHK